MKPSIGFIASGVIAWLGYQVGAPLEAVLALIMIGTAIEFAFLRK